MLPSVETISKRLGATSLSYHLTVYFSSCNFHPKSESHHTGCKASTDVIHFLATNLVLSQNFSARWLATSNESFNFRYRLIFIFLFFYTYGKIWSLASLIESSFLFPCSAQIDFSTSDTSFFMLGRSTVRFENAHWASLLLRSKSSACLINYKKKYFKKILTLNRFQERYNEKSFKKIKRLKSLQKSVFRTHASIYDGAFLWIYLTALYFCNISAIVDLRLGYV